MEAAANKTAESVLSNFLDASVYPHTVEGLLEAARDVRYALNWNGTRAYASRDVIANRIFTDGKGNFRKVLGTGERWAKHEGQKNKDCCIYVVLKTNGYKSSGKEGHFYRCTRPAFAAWSKLVISPEELTALGILDFDLVEQGYKLIE